MLGILEMTVEECIDSYNDICKRIFKDEGWKARVSGQGGWRPWSWGAQVTIKSAFDHRVLEECILEKIRDRCPSCESTGDAREVLLNDGNESRCKV